MTHRTIRNCLVGTTLVLAAGLPLPASALVLVGGAGPAVTVDTSVLDGASSRRFDAVPDTGLLMPGERGLPGERVHLVPPGQTSTRKIVLKPPAGMQPATGKKLLLPGAERIVLTPPPGVAPRLTPPKRAAAPAKKAPSAAEIEAEVNAETVKPAAKPAPMAKPMPMPAPVPAETAKPLAPLAPPAPAEIPAEPTPIAPAEPAMTAPAAPAPSTPAAMPPAAETAAPPAIPAVPEVPAPPALAEPAPAPAMPAPPAAPTELTPPRVAAVAPTAPAAPAVPAPAPQAMTPTATIALAFEPEDARLSDTHRALLKSVVARLSEDPDASVQLLAYAQGENRSKARRLSLSRALAVRSYLLSQDVRNTRIEVRALGDQVPPGGKPDRVDVIIEKP